MRIGTTKELKNHEYRVGLTPDNVMAYVSNGHEVYVEKTAGIGAGFSDAEYEAAGAVILETPQEVFDCCDKMCIRDRAGDRSMSPAGALQSRCSPTDPLAGFSGWAALLGGHSHLAGVYRVCLLYTSMPPRSPPMPRCDQ